MNENKKFAQVGRFIYEFQRVRATLGSLYQMLEHDGAASDAADLELGELANRSVALFAQKRAADVVAVAGFSAVIDMVLKYGARLDAFLAQVDLDNVPDEEEIHGVLNCQHELERYQRLVATS